MHEIACLPSALGWWLGAFEVKSLTKLLDQAKQQEEDSCGLQQLAELRMAQGMSYAQEKKEEERDAEMRESLWSKGGAFSFSGSVRAAQSLRHAEVWAAAAAAGGLLDANLTRHWQLRLPHGGVHGRTSTAPLECVPCGFSTRACM